MARKVFGGDDVEVRGPRGTALLSAAGLSATVTTDAAGLVPADIQTYPGGVAIAGAVVTVDGDSHLPLFYGPDGVDDLWASCNGGTPGPIHPNEDSRLDALETSVPANLVTATGRAVTFALIFGD